MNNFAEANPGHLTKSWLINLVDEWMLVSSVITAVTCYDVLSLIKFFCIDYAYCSLLLSQAIQFRLILFISEWAYTGQF